MLDAGRWRIAAYEVEIAVPAHRGDRNDRMTVLGPDSFRLWRTRNDSWCKSGGSYVGEIAGFSCSIFATESHDYTVISTERSEGRNLSKQTISVLPIVRAIYEIVCCDRQFGSQGLLGTLQPLIAKDVQIKPINFTVLVQIRAAAPVRRGTVG